MIRKVDIRPVPAAGPVGGVAAAAGDERYNRAPRNWPRWQPHDAVSKSMEHDRARDQLRGAVEAPSARSTRPARAAASPPIDLQAARCASQAEQAAAGARLAEQKDACARSCAQLHDGPGRQADTAC